VERRDQVKSGKDILQAQMLIEALAVKRPHDSETRYAVARRPVRGVTRRGQRRCGRVHRPRHVPIAGHDAGGGRSSRSPAISC
jgi:hypothetical protein